MLNKKMIKILSFLLILMGFMSIQLTATPIYISFHWHMHQPIYWPYENINDTENSGGSKYSFSVAGVHYDRMGPYTSWPKDAVGKGLNLPNAGAQVSFSGSLIENLNNLQGNSDWAGSYREAKGWKTSMGNPRLDMVAFGYHHPLMGLIGNPSIIKQIGLHKIIHNKTWGGAYSKGMFPPENAFSKRMIPGLVDQGIEWVMVDNIHFDRTCKNYPWTKDSGIYPPNKADQINPDPNDWIQRSGMWAPSKVSAGFGYRPHYTEHVDPATGQKMRIIVVPTAHYEGNEDGRGGFGALNYESVLSQLKAANTDSNHPILVVLHHDGDNYGGGTDSYYHSNFQQFVDWVSSNPDFEWTTIQDYLDRFPPAANDVINVADGSWAGAGSDPEFSKWNGDEDADGYSYDRNSWAVLTAAENRVKTASAITPITGYDEIMNGTGNDSDKAWHYFLNGQTSCYWYWDGTEKWDSHPTRAANQAVAKADNIINAHPSSDSVGPSIYTLQRDPYNPGEYEWMTVPEASDFKVWTFVYDVAGLGSVTLKYRTHVEEVSDVNRVYNGGTWVNLTMTGSEYGASLTDPLPTYRAKKYVAEIAGLTNIYVDYYVEAVDSKGNITKSDIYHVWVGNGSGGSGGGAGVTMTPTEPSAGYPVTVRYDGSLKGSTEVTMHWGYDDFTGVQDTVMNKEADGTWSVTITVPAVAVNTLDLVFKNESESWDNNGGNDWHANLIPWSGSDSEAPTVSLTSPVAGTTVTGTVQLTASASDNVGVTRVEFFAGATKISEDTTAPYTATLTTTAYANGGLELKVIAYDAAANSTIASKTVTVYNEAIVPAVDFSLDKPLTAVSGTFVASVTATISGSNGITSVDMKIDGGVAIVDSTFPFSFSYDSATLSDANHTIEITAYASNGSKTSTTKIITVNNSQASVLRKVHYYSTVKAAGTFIQYKQGAAFNSFPGDRMSGSSTANWYDWQATLPTGNIEARFIFSGGRWDNNSGVNYVIVNNEVWIKDGVVYNSDPNQVTDNPPTLTEVIAPTGNVTGTIAIAASATDDKGVVKVEIYVNNIKIGEDVTAPYSVSVDTSSLGNGSYSVKAIAYDTIGQTGEATTSITVLHSAPAPDTKTIHYSTAWATPYIHYNNGDWTAVPGDAMTSEGGGWFVKTLTSTGSLEFVFNDGNGNWDNNSEANYTTIVSEVWVKDSTIYTINPTPVNPTNVNPTNAITVYFKKPAGWGVATIYYWETTPATPALTWPGVNMTDAGNGWYSFEINASSGNIIFSDNGQSQSADLTWDGKGWYDGQNWTDTNPDGPQPPVVSASKQGYFVGDSVAVTLSIVNGSDLSRYTTDGSDPAVGGISFTDGTVVTIGAGMALNQTNVLRVYATNAQGAFSTSFGYVKVDEIPQAAFSWDNATVYFVLTDRFKNGNTGNDNSYGRPQGFGTGDWHGGDLAGLTQKLNDNYFTDLGVNAIWISCPFEQIHGWVVGGGNGFKHYAYHGYYIQDFTNLDENMGTAAELQTFIDTAHAKGIRVVFDIVLNHAGYNTMSDMNQYEFGTLLSGWENANLGNYHDLIDYNSSNWINWWGADWVRAGLPGYDSPGGDDQTKCLAGLPDFKTENPNAVGLPTFYAKKQTHAEYIANYSVSDYLIKWVTDWVGTYGVDGFRVDTAKHVGLDVWKRLKAAAVTKLRAWKAANPTKKVDDLDFWMTGEVWGHGVGRSDYFDNGFDSVINFTYQGAAGGAISNPGNIDGTYANYASSINSDPTFNALSYISSHDTSLFFASSAGNDNSKQKVAGSLLLLTPGAVQIYYGDENARPLGPQCSDEDQRTRSDIQWPGNTDVLAHWQKVGQFRNRHIAIGAGAHSKMSDSPYTFSRVKDNDKVICVLGASGSVAVNVGSIFGEGVSVRNYYTGATATVTGGIVTFDAGANGVILIEEAK